MRRADAPRIPQNHKHIATYVAFQNCSGVPLNKHKGAVMKVLRFKDVQAKVGLGRTTIWRLERAGEFPKRRELVRGLKGWLESDIDAWIQQRFGISAQNKSVGGR